LIRVQSPLVIAIYTRIGDRHRPQPQEKPKGEKPILAVKLRHRSQFWWSQRSRGCAGIL